MEVQPGGPRQRFATPRIPDADVNAAASGAPFIANPDQVERFAQSHPPAEDDRDTHYAGHTEGHIDSPAFTTN